MTDDQLSAIRGRLETLQLISMEPLHLIERYGSIIGTFLAAAPSDLAWALGEIETADAELAHLRAEVGGLAAALAEEVNVAHQLEADLERAYMSQVDPRLNYEQAIELSLLIARRGARLNGRTTL